MVYVITHSAVQRNRHFERWWLRGAVYTVASVLSSSAIGAALGYAGGHVSATDRGRAAAAVAVAAIIFGSSEVLGKQIRLPQRSRETSRRPLWAGSLLLAAAYNGVALGVGAATRIGFWIWYAVPIGALLIGDPRLGSLIYLAYGATRGAAPWALLATNQVAKQNIRVWLVQRSSLALLTSGVASVIAGSLVLTWLLNSANR